MNSVKIGIIGTGRIAERFVKDVSKLKEIEVRIVYNPHIDSAIEFSKQFENIMVADNLEEFMNRCNIVYIASPHETHYAYIGTAIRKNKHVICEKPMFLSCQEARDMLRLAKERKRYLVEAIKTKYCPGYKKLLQVVGEKPIGDIKDVEACFTKLEGVNTRELTNTQYGGSFRELASYCLLPVYDLLGNNYKDIRFLHIDNELGIDTYTKLLIDYGNKFATVKVGLGVKSEGQLIISGTKGYIIVQAPWWKTSHFEVHYEDPTDVQIYDIPYVGEGLTYEINELLQRIKYNKDIYVNESQILFMATLMEKFENYRRGIASKLPEELVCPN